MKGLAFKPEYLLTERDMPRNPLPGTAYWIEEGPMIVLVRGDGSLLKFSGGGGDPNDLGAYPSLNDLKIAHPTAEAGNFARVVNETENLLCVWDVVLNDWKASAGGKADVNSVNHRMPDANGNVTLGADDVGTLGREQIGELFDEFTADLKAVGEAGEKAKNKDAPGGYAGLDEDGHVARGAIPAATTDAVGGMRIASDEEVDAETDDSKGMTPAKTKRMIEKKVPAYVSTDVYIDTGLTVLAAYEGEATFEMEGPLSAIGGKLAVGDKIKVVNNPVKIVTVTAIAEEEEPPEGETARVYVTIDAAVLTAEDNGAGIGRGAAVAPDYPSDYDPKIEVVERKLVTAGHRNVIINGAMEIAQRAATFSGTGYGSLDRFRLLKAATLAQSKAIADIQGVPGATAVAKMTATATAGMSMCQRIESAAMFSGEKATLSFWARGSKEMPLNINVTRSAGGTINLSKVIALSTLWRRYEVTFDVPYISAAVTPNTTYLQVEFDASPASVGDTVYLGNVQMEAGEVATAFERRNYGDELRLCRRYFQKNSASEMVCWAVPTTAIFAGIFPFPEKLRVPPSITLSHSSAWTGTREGQLPMRNIVANLGTIQVDCFNVGYGSDRGMTVPVYVSKLNLPRGASYYYTADAEF